MAGTWLREEDGSDTGDKLLLECVVGGGWRQW